VSDDDGSGLAVLTALLNAGIRTRFSKIEGYGTVFQAPQGSEGYAALHDLPDGPTRDAALKAFADSFKVSESAASSYHFKGFDADDE